MIDSWETFYARTLSHLSTKANPKSNDQTQAHAQDQTKANDENADSEDEDDGQGEEDDDSDPGTSWFSEHNAPDKILHLLTSDEFPLAPCNTLQSNIQRKKFREVLDDQPRLLDLGTGNGSMLALLRRKGGFRGEMVGVDYSGRSVELARELQRVRGHSAYDDSESEGEDQGEDEGEDEGTQIRFEEYDILNSDPLPNLEWFPHSQNGFDIVLDKGTFDAVSLSDEIDRFAQRRVCERYPVAARGLVRRGGFLVVTSCNWTEEELVRWFTGGCEEDRFEVWGRVEYPRFRFGGKEGQGVCTVCFQRV